MQRERKRERETDKFPLSLLTFQKIFIRIIVSLLSDIHCHSDDDDDDDEHHKNDDCDCSKVPFIGQ